MRALLVRFPGCLAEALTAFVASLGLVVAAVVLGRAHLVPAVLTAVVLVRFPSFVAEALAAFVATLGDVFFAKLGRAHLVRFHTIRFLVCTRTTAGAGRLVLGECIRAESPSAFGAGLALVGLHCAFAAVETGGFDGW